MTDEGQIQTMMEEMDGMNMSEDAKRQIIEDKIINHGGNQGQYMFPSQEAYDRAVSGANLMSKEYSMMQQGKGMPTGVNMTSQEAKAVAFSRIANNPNVPMDQRITAALRRESGAAYNEEEAIDMRSKLEAMDAEKRNATGAGVTPNEESYFQKRLKEASGAGKFLMDPTGLIRKGGNKALKMFMGRPVQTSGYDRGPIRPRYDEFGNLIPQRPTMMV
jgi:hypothetical protein